MTVNHLFDIYTYNLFDEMQQNEKCTFGMISAGGSSRFLLLPRIQQHMVKQMATISNEAEHAPDAIIMIDNFPEFQTKR